MVICSSLEQLALNLLEKKLCDVFGPVSTREVENGCAASFEEKVFVGSLSNPKELTLAARASDSKNSARNALLEMVFEAGMGGNLLLKTEEGVCPVEIDKGMGTVTVGKACRDPEVLTYTCLPTVGL